MSASALNPKRLSRVLAETESLVKLFAAKGKQLYLVGGAIRNMARTAGVTDLASGHFEDDYDLTTNAVPAEIIQIVEPAAQTLWTQGAQFGTIGCQIAGRRYEITTHRKEAYDPVSRKPAVVFGEDIQVDLSRRDFTMNAMALKLPEGRLLDPFGGLEALAGRLLKTPLSAEESFRDDPLRMLRAARFTAQFGLTPSQEIVMAMQDMKQRLEIVSSERILAELLRLLGLADPTAGLELLVDTGLDELVFRADGADKVLAGNEIYRLAKLPPTASVRLCALLYDADSTAKVLGRLRLPNQLRREIVAIGKAVRELLLVCGRAKPPSQPQAAAQTITAPQVRGWMLQVARAWRPDQATTQPELVSRIFEVAGVLASEQGLADSFKLFQQLHARQPPMVLPISGADVMSALNIPAGPTVRQALDYVTGLMVAQGKLDKSEALDKLGVWWQSRA